MSVSSTEGVGSYFGTPAATTATGTGSTSGSSSTDQMNKDMFLKLMVAQLKIPGPDEPHRLRAVPRPDGAVHLAGEAASRSPTRPPRLLTAQMAFGASSLVGRSVTYTGDRRRRTRPARSTPSASPPPARCSRSAAPRSPSPASSRSRRPDPPHLRTTPAPTASTHQPSQPADPGHRSTERNHHASLALLRHQRPPRQPDHARRDRQQHRQRQHRRLQGQHHRLPGHPEPDAHRPAPARERSRGGTNPIQVGLGVQVGGVTTNFNQGSAQTTGRATDLMISGRRLLRGRRTATRSSTPAPAPSTSTRPATWSPRTATACRATPARRRRRPPTGGTGRRQPRHPGRSPARDPPASS